MEMKGFIVFGNIHLLCSFGRRQVCERNLLHYYVAINFIPAVFQEHKPVLVQALVLNTFVERFMHVVNRCA